MLSYAEKLQISNRELQDFALVAAHDLQEPLRKIQAYADRLTVKFKNVLGREGNDFLDRMHKSASRMQRLIDDLLTYSRVTSKAQPFTQTNLNDIVAEALIDLDVRIERTKASISVLPLPIIRADPSQMRQLFQNLLANALKFHKPGESAVVTVQNAVSSDKVVIEVIDDGIGFDEKYLDRIFTIFQRLHGRNEYEGTGVGLSICRKIAERHGGTLTARSQLNHGSTFIVTLPINQT